MTMQPTYYLVEPFKSLCWRYALLTQQEDHHNLRWTAVTELQAAGLIP